MPGTLGRAHRPIDIFGVPAGTRREYAAIARINDRDRRALRGADALVRDEVRGRGDTDLGRA
jgi:hypothetical protein